MEAISRQMRTIPLIKPDLPTFDEVEAPFREIMATGKITNFGKYVRHFEEEAGAYLGTEVATVSSGSMALLFTLNALGLQPGQRVALPSFTFMATAQAVCFAGGVPVFVEVEEDLTLSVDDLSMLLERYDNIGVVIPVHTYGLPCRSDEIDRMVADAGDRAGRKISVMYDAAHAFGSSRAGRSVGGGGDAEVFSLSVTKALVSVEGGMVSSSNGALIDRIRKMRNYGIESNYDAHYPGLNGKMSEFHAVVGLENLRRLDRLIATRQVKARYYLDAIQSRTPFATFPWPRDVIHTFKDLTVIVPESFGRSRQEVMDFLATRGVETRAYFSPPVHEQALFRQFADRRLPLTENLSRRVITVPFYTSITNEEIDYVVDALAEAAA